MPPDILILGGGPAGLSTALHLAQLAPGLAPRVLVLEKARYPRHKLCGGALTVDAEVLLARLGLDVSQIPIVAASEAHFDFAGSGLSLTFPDDPALRMIRRDEFDAWLAAATRSAGIEIREGVVVRTVRPQANGVSVQTDAGVLEAAIVVGADGSNGVTRRSIFPDSPIHTARALEILSDDAIAGEAQRPALGGRDHVRKAAYFDFFCVPLGIAGYTWDFPTQVDGKPMRCWGIYDTNLLAHRHRPPLKDALAAEMARQRTGLDIDALQGHPIRWFTPFTRFSVPRVILVGDAAGADGIFGEGISFALGYGRLAAQAIHDAIGANDFSFRSYRRRVLRSPLGQALLIRTTITHVLYNLRWAWFQKIFWRVLKPAVRALALVLVLNWAKRMK